LQKQLHLSNKRYGIIAYYIYVYATAQIKPFEFILLFKHIITPQNDFTILAFQALCVIWLHSTHIHDIANIKYKVLFSSQKLQQSVH
jgi:hypothetical protein